MSSTSTNQSIHEHDYEILIRRRGESDYASYCPQLAHMIKGTAHEEVEEAMKSFIRQHIAMIANASHGTE